MLACAFLFGAKLAFELGTGSAVFAGELGPGIVTVPLAHLTGAAAGVACGMWSRRRASPAASLA